jgi:cell wall-associated NlpC family hydrolase
MSPTTPATVHGCDSRADGSPEHPGHVGMFIGSYHGQGLVVQAPETGEDIKITPLAGYWAQQTCVGQPARVTVT